MCACGRQQRTRFARKGPHACVPLCQGHREPAFPKMAPDVSTICFSRCTTSGVFSWPSPRGRHQAPKRLHHTNAQPAIIDVRRVHRCSARMSKEAPCRIRPLGREPMQSRVCSVEPTCLWGRLLCCACALEHLRECHNCTMHERMHVHVHTHTHTQTLPGRGECTRAAGRTLSPKAAKCR